MSRAVRTHRAGHVERSPPSIKTKEAVKRASAIFLRLRERGEWFIDSASVYQCWTLHLDGTRYRVAALTSAFLDGPRAPGIVFSVTIRAARSERPVGEHVLSTPWFRGLQKRLGPNYASDGIARGRIDLVRVLRGTTEPSVVLHELHGLAAAIEGKSTSARGRDRSRSRTVKSLEKQREDVWTVLDALRATGWRVSTLCHGLQRQVRHDGCRWHVSARFKALVDSADNHPGFAGMVDSWSRLAERTKRANPISKAAELLRRSGHRRLADTHYQRWHRGLGRRAAEDEIQVLERAVSLMVERPNG